MSSVLKRLVRRVRRRFQLEDRIYSAIVRERDVCFDVGANIGDVALLLSQLAGPEGAVVSFEPVWPMYLRMCKNIQTARAVAPIATVPAGLADSERDATIQVRGSEFEYGSLARDGVGPEGATDIATYNVRLITLDGFLRGNRQKAPDFIKIDVEGAEMLVLRGAEQFFASGARPIMLIEIFAPWERAFGYAPYEPLSWLQERGYRTLFVCPQGLIEHSPTAAVPTPAEYEMGYNVVAYHPDHHAERFNALGPLKAGRKPAWVKMPLPPCANR